VRLLRLQAEDAVDPERLELLLDDGEAACVSGDPVVQPIPLAEEIVLARQGVAAGLAQDPRDLDVRQAELEAELAEVDAFGAAGAEPIVPAPHPPGLVIEGENHDALPSLLPSLYKPPERATVRTAERRNGVA